MVSKPDGSAAKNSVIIPAFNEEEGLPVVLEAVLSSVDGDFEVVVVDDGSTDRTAEVAKAFPCKLIRHPSNKGKGEAMKTGARHGGENLIFIDADGTYPASMIPEIARLLESYDMVVCSRVNGKEHIPAFNRVGNAIFRNAVKLLSGFPAYDPLTGLYGIKKVWFERANLVSRGFDIEVELAIKAARMGLKVKDLPIQYGRRIGEAKLNGLKDGYRILRRIGLTLLSFRAGPPALDKQACEVAQAIERVL